ncbi:hypothetical protein [Yinghuangia aomiensis]|uniref:hypothetical protein n=1 Tax=Yinghuangia aomiensis TaxID=676205 RepID=UPI0031EEFE2E
MGATQAAVVVPDVIAEVRGAAEHDGAGLDRALDDGTALIHKVVAPALYGRGLQVTAYWVRDRLAATVPRDPAKTAGSDLASASNAAPDLTPLSWSPGPAPVTTAHRDAPTPAWVASTPPIGASKGRPRRGFPRTDTGRRVAGPPVSDPGAQAPA